MAFTEVLQKPSRVRRDMNGEEAVGKPLIQNLNENATLITSILAALAAIIAIIRGAIKLYSTRKVQVVELLEMPAKLNREVGEIITRLNAMEQMGGITRSALDVATWECDPHGYCIDASPALCELFGLSREEMLGRGWLSVIESDTEREEAWQEWAGSVANNIAYRDSYTIVNRRTGERVRCTTTSRAILDANSHVVRFVGYVRREVVS